jgi:DME family drug/metabolite transporter
VLARVFFKETLTVMKLTALAMTLAGVVGVSFGAGQWKTGFDEGIGMTAVASGLLAGFCYSMYYLFGKHFSGRYSSPNIFLYMLPVGALCLFPWVDFTHKTPTAWAALTTLAFFSTYLAYYFYYLGLKVLEASRAAITATLEPVMAAAVAYVWWNEYFSLSGYLGGGLILGAVILIIWEGLQKQRRRTGVR